MGVTTAIEVDVILVFHIRQVDVAFNPDFPMLCKLVSDAGLQGKRERFTFIDTVSRIFRVGIDVITGISNTKTKNRTKSERPRILAVADVILRNDGNIDEREMVVISTIFLRFECVFNHFTIAHARHHRPLLGKIII